MKAVLISIQPRYCEKIASGKKTVEVRKTAPKIPTPFKCYIYETKDRRFEDIAVCWNDGTPDFIHATGKVIGEFVCDEITRYEGEFWDDETYECVRERYEPDDFEEYGEYEYETIADNEQENYKDVPLFKQSCLTCEEFRKYLGKGDHVFYGWHISNLKIYDEPKELSEFTTPFCPYEVTKCKVGACLCKHFTFKDAIGGECDYGKHITRPPQSWMYVEEEECLP